MEPFLFALNCAHYKFPWGQGLVRFLKMGQLAFDTDRICLAQARLHEYLEGQIEDERNTIFIENKGIEVGIIKM